MLQLITDLEEILLSGQGIDGFKKLFGKTILPPELYWNTVYCYLGFQLLVAQTDKQLDHLAYLKELSGRVAIIIDALNNRPPGN